MKNSDYIFTLLIDYINDTHKVNHYNSHEEADKAFYQSCNDKDIRRARLLNAEHQLIAEVNN